MRIPGIRNALAYVQQLGPRRAAYRAAYILANKPAAISVFDCLRLRPEDVNQELASPTEAYECRFLAADEVQGSLEALDAIGRRVAREAMERDDLCYAVLSAGRPVNLGFYARRATPVLNDLMVHFAPPYWYMYGGYTDPEHRGRRLHALGVLRASLELFGHGVPALVTLYERTNYRSMVSALRMGWRPCGTLYRVGAGGWMRVGRSAGARAIGMHLERRTGPSA